jgi:hypothetical protein
MMDTEEAEDLLEYTNSLLEDENKNTEHPRMKPTSKFHMAAGGIVTGNHTRKQQQEMLNMNFMRKEIQAHKVELDRAQRNVELAKRALEEESFLLQRLMDELMFLDSRQNEAQRGMSTSTQRSQLLNMIKSHQSNVAGATSVLRQAEMLETKAALNVRKDEASGKVAEVQEFMKTSNREAKKKMAAGQFAEQRNANRTIKRFEDRKQRGVGKELEMQNKAKQQYRQAIEGAAKAKQRMETSTRAKKQTLSQLKQAQDRAQRERMSAMLSLKVNTDAAYVTIVGNNQRRQMRQLEKEENFRSTMIANYRGNGNNGSSSSSSSSNSSANNQYVIGHAFQNQQAEARRQTSRREQEQRADRIREQVRSDFLRERKQRMAAAGAAEGCNIAAATSCARGGGHPRKQVRFSTPTSPPASPKLYEPMASRSHGGLTIINSSGQSYRMQAQAS